MVEQSKLGTVIEGIKDKLERYGIKVAEAEQLTEADLSPKVISWINTPDETIGKEERKKRISQALINYALIGQIDIGFLKIFNEVKDNLIEQVSQAEEGTVKSRLTTGEIENFGVEDLASTVIVALRNYIREQEGYIKDALQDMSEEKRENEKPKRMLQMINHVRDRLENEIINCIRTRQIQKEGFVKE